ncbi:MAG: glycosyltransferase family 4 protein [Anaerolineae bacterium]|nr:glycosyltransferase family 4 protein [Anaerolineae bacterium]
MAHVCIITSVHQPFDGRIFHREARSLARAGYQVTLLAPADFAREEREGVTVVGVPRPARRWARPLAWLRLYRLARRLRPDAVHIHDPELLLLLPFLRLTLGRRARLIYDAHEYFVDSIAVKQWIPPRLRPLVARAAGWTERLLAQRAHGLVLAVEGQKDEYGYFRGPIAVARNLPLASLFEGSQPHPALEVDGFRLIYVGLILPQRGIDLLLEALLLLREKGVDDVHLFLLGAETSPAYMNQMRSFAREHGLEQQVHWMGYVQPDQLKHYLANAHAGLAPLMPTRQYSRPFLATKLFEYMLAGLPIVCADQPNWRAHVEEAGCGIVVPAGEPAAYARAIRRLRDDPAGARAMGERGRETVLAHYTWEREEERLLALYETLLTGQEKG